MSLITQSGSPALWTILNSAWMDSDEPGWVINDGVHYEVQYELDGSVAFVQRTTNELMDSRTFTGPAATYTKLDDG
jgi:hypothetical protein